MALQQETIGCCDMIGKWTYFLGRAMLRLRRRVRKHDVFMSLGRNCEVAFRYFRRNGFVESSLFQWSGFYTLAMMVEGLENFDRIFTGEVIGPNPLYTCQNTNLRAHGKLPQSTWTNGVTDENRAVAEADKADLVSRMAYLKKKFVDQLSGGGALVVYKARTEDWLREDGEILVRRLHALLLQFGARDFDFVLVLEECCKQKQVLWDIPRFFVRYVSAFNPEDKVTDMSYGDKYGWRLIFDEFRPRVQKLQKHKFKFENEGRGG